MQRIGLLSLLLFLTFFSATALAENSASDSDSLREMLVQAARVSLTGEEILLYGVPKSSGPPRAVVLEAQLYGKRLRARPKGAYKKRYVDLGLLKTGPADAIRLPDGRSIAVEILALPPQILNGDRLDTFDRPGS